MKSLIIKTPKNQYYSGKVLEVIVDRAIERMLRSSFRISGNKFNLLDVEYCPVWARNKETKEKMFLRIMIKNKHDNSKISITNDDICKNGVDYEEVISFLDRSGVKRIVF
tara:strand:- start:350 stop:679 length:330 start_codon:yes stop_codon:yes gene_type:complete